MLEKTLESPLDSKEIKPVNPKEISPEYSLEGLMLKLKLQYSGHLMWRADSLKKTLMLGKTEGKRKRELGQKRKWLDNITETQWTWIWTNSGRQWRTGEPGVLQRAGHDLAAEQQQMGSVPRVVLWSQTMWVMSRLWHFLELSRTLREPSEIWKR